MATFTRKAIMQTFLHILKNKPLDRITVKDICEQCEINRNTFYYHFPDIRELILWTISNDIYQRIRNLECTEGSRIREFAIDYLQKNGKFLNFAYDHLGFDAFWDYHARQLCPIIQDHIESLLRQNGQTISPTYEQFLAEFYAEQVASIYLMQFRKPEHYQSTAAMKCLEMIFDYGIPDMLSHAEELRL